MRSSRWRKLKDRAEALDHERAVQPALDVRSVMEVVVGSQDRSLEELLQAERRAVRTTLGRPDSREWIKAFLEKRKPVFNQ